MCVSIHVDVEQSSAKWQF